MSISANNDLVLHLFKIRIYLQCFMTIIPDLSTENNLVNCSDQLIFLGPYFKIKPEVLKIYYHFTNFKQIIFKSFDPLACFQHLNYSEVLQNSTKQQEIAQISQNYFHYFIFRLNNGKNLYSRRSQCLHYLKLAQVDDPRSLEIQVQQHYFYFQLQTDLQMTVDAQVSY